MFLNKIKVTLIKIIPRSIKEILKYFLNDIRNIIDFIKTPIIILEEKIERNKWLSPKDIDTYRRKIKIYDIFTFFNEIELLEIRLNILNPYVDYFVIIEATETFTGLPKKLYFEENKHLFERWNHKIIHYVIKDTPKDRNELRERLNNDKIQLLDKQIITDSLTSDNIPIGQDQWLKEFYQKETIKKALLGLFDDDFCFISDLDEIWNTEIKIDYSRDNIFKLKQNPYVYYLNNRSNENWAGWTGTIATKYKNIKDNCLNHLRTDSKTTYTTLLNGGWHFTFQGGIEKIKQKLESYGHQEINTEKIKSELDKNLNENKDIRKRHIKFWRDDNNLPKYILENKDKYKNLFRD